MYFRLCGCLWIIKLMWVALSFLRVPNIIKHLVKSFSRVKLTAAGKPLEIAFVAGSIISLLAFTVATEGIIRTLKRAGGREMLRGRIFRPPIRVYLQKREQHSRKRKKKKLACQTERLPKLHTRVKERSSYFKETFAKQLRRLKSFFYVRGLESRQNIFLLHHIKKKYD